MTATEFSRQPDGSSLARLEQILVDRQVVTTTMTQATHRQLGGYLLGQAGLSGRSLESLIELTRDARSQFDRRQTYLKLSQTSARSLIADAGLSWDALDELADSFLPSLSDKAADVLIRCLMTGSGILSVLQAASAPTTSKLDAVDTPQLGEGPTDVSTRTSRSAA